MAVLVASVGACGGGVAGGGNYPGKSDVIAAHGAWCDSLAKYLGGGKEWPHLAECKSGSTSASAAYLRGMSRCFGPRIESLGDQAPDNQQVVSECNDQVTTAMPVDENVGREVLAARCDRMKKCEKVEIADCKTGVDKLESAQKALLTTIYNAPALHEIADCLSSSSCTEDEEKARDACYKPLADKLLWFPG
jgi:hypothetical protein